MILFWDETKTFELIVLDNLLNEKQTLIINRMQSICSNSFNSETYGHFISIEVKLMDYLSIVIGRPDHIISRIKLDLEKIVKSNVNPQNKNRKINSFEIESKFSNY